MTPTARPFRDADLPRLAALASAATAAGRPHAYFHAGDLVWRRYQHEDAVAAPRAIRLWEDDGALLGFAWLASGSVELLVHPDRADRMALEEAMLRWALGRRPRPAADGGAGATLRANVFDDDEARIALLTRLGFAPTETFFLHLHRALDGPLPPVAPPPGVVIRPVAGETEFAERVDLHREVWQPSRVTLPAYRRLRGVAGYRPDLDLVAVLPDGALAAYCIAWFDPASGVGEFEPVGTRPADRRRGLGAAVLREGLRRLQALGATRALVYSYGPNVAATRLYELVDFRVAVFDRTYVHG